MATLSKKRVSSRASADCIKNETTGQTVYANGYKGRKTQPKKKK